MGFGISGAQQVKRTALKGASLFSFWITAPAASVDTKQHQHVRLLSAFFIVTFLNTLGAAMLFKNTSRDLWIILLALSAVLFACYIISRSKYHRVTTVLAAILPVTSFIAIIIIQPAGVNLAPALIWLTLPLFAAGLMLSFWQSGIILVSYLIMMIAFAFSSLVGLDILIPLAIFSLVSTFFTSSFSIPGRENAAIKDEQIIERHQSEKDIDESEEIFSKVFQSSPNAMSLSTLSDGRFKAINDSYTRITGFTREELLNQNADDFSMWVKPEQRDKMFDYTNRRECIRNEEMDFRNKTGEIRTTLVSTEFLQLAGEPCLLVVSIDVTDYKSAQKALNKSKQQLEIFTHLSPQQILMTRLKDGKFIEFNDNFTRVTGYSREDIIGKTSLQIGFWAHPEDRKRLLTALKDNRHADNMEFEFRIKSGAIITELISSEPLEIDGEECIITVLTDITERKRVEQALKASEEKFSKVFQAIPEDISLSRINDWTFIDVNQGFCTHTQHTREEIIGHTGTEIGLPEKPGNLEEIIDTIQKEGGIFNREMVLHPQTDQMIARRFSAYIIDIANEPCLLTIGTDITERKRMEQALKESEEKLSKTFQAIPEAIAISRVKDGALIDVNERFLTASGLTRDQVIGHSASELKLEDRPNERNEFIETIKKEGRIINRERHKTDKNGVQKTTLFSADIININSEPCVISISHDITNLKQIEKALAESEEKFSKAFQAIPECISISRVKDGVFIDANDSFLRTWLRSREQVMGHTGYELKMWDRPILREEIIRKVMESGPIINKEREAHNVRGETRTVLFSADIINIIGEPCLISISNDITEIKHIEKALAESEEKFSKAFQAIPESVVITTLEDGIFVEANENFCRAIGRARDEIIGHTSQELSLSGNPEWRNIMVERLKTHGKITNEEISYGENRANHGLISADIIEIGGVPCMISVSNDITELKNMEKALRESEEKFSKIFRLSPQQIIVSRLYGDKMPVTIDVNESFTNLSGYSREELIGKTINELNLWKNPEDSEQVLKIMREQGRLRNYEFEFYVRTGEVHTGLLSSEALMINGEPCTISILTDITERKQAEEQLKFAMMELELSSAQLRATNKELESFSYSVSHDLRAPLRSIDGFSQALLEDYAPKLDETARDYLNRMRNASQKMGELIDGILKLSRLTRGDMHRETVDLSALAEEICRRFQQTDPERKVEISIARDIKVNGDQQMLRSLMENLLGNSWKFTQKTPEAHIEFGSTLTKGKKTFYVKDNGAGFDMAFTDQLFGAFQRLHSSADFPGTGIGLATVRRIINRHGGSIRAEGAVDHGAVFYFTL